MLLHINEEAKKQHRNQEKASSEESTSVNGRSRWIVLSEANAVKGQARGSGESKKLKNIKNTLTAII